MYKAKKLIIRSTLVPVFALMLVGCASHHAIRQLASTDPSAQSIRLNDAKPIEEFDSDDLQVNLTDKITLPASDDPVYFGEADAFGEDDPDTAIAAIPLIVIHPGTIWKAVPLVGPGLDDAGWKYVGTGPGLREVWGVLDTSVGDSRSDFVVAHSTDGAATFNLKVFHKPHRLATVSDFAMSKTGCGSVTLSLDADCGPHKMGLYRYDTIDQGKTWTSKPHYEADAMIHSNTVPDGEQPADIDHAVRAIFRAPHRSSVSR